MKCRRKLMRDGEPYPKSNCDVHGSLVTGRGCPPLGRVVDPVTTSTPQHTAYAVIAIDSQTHRAIGIDVFSEDRPTIMGHVYLATYDEVRRDTYGEAGDAMHDLLMADRAVGELYARTGRRCPRGKRGGDIVIEMGQAPLTDAETYKAQMVAECEAKQEATARAELAERLLAGSRDDCVAIARERDDAREAHDAVVKDGWEVLWHERVGAIARADAAEDRCDVKQKTIDALKRDRDAERKARRDDRERHLAQAAALELEKYRLGSLSAKLKMERDAAVTHAESTKNRISVREVLLASERDALRVVLSAVRPFVYLDEEDSTYPPQTIAQYRAAKRAMASAKTP